MTKVYAALELASQSGNPGSFATLFLRHGYQWVIDQFRPAYEAGAVGMVGHRVRGESHEGGDYMNMDSGKDLERDPEARKILDQEEWFLETFAKEFPSARLIAYFGSSKEPDLQGRIDRGDLRQFWDRYGASFGPWFNSPIVDICFDHAGSFRQRDPHGAAVVAVDALLAQHGRTVYVEPQPQSWSVTGPMPYLCTEDWIGRWGDHTRTGIIWLNGHGVRVFPQWAATIADPHHTAWALHRARQGHDIAIGPEHVPAVMKALGLTDTAKGGG